MTATSLSRLLSDRAAMTPDALAMVVGENETTFAELAARAEAFARGYLARGIEPGDRIAIMMPNSVDWVAAFFACDMVGAAAVAVNARYRSHELAYLLSHCKPSLVLTSDEVEQWIDYMALLEEAAPGLAEQADPRALAIPDLPWLRTIVLAGRGDRSPALDVAEFLADGDRSVLGPIEPVDPGDRTGLLLYTSGTTAAPKACEIRGRGLIQNWTNWGEMVGLGERDAVWAPCPFFHISGTGPLIGTIAAGATFLTAQHFESDLAVEQIRRYRPAHLFAGFPALTLGVLQAPAYDQESFSFIRTAHCVAPLGVQQSIQDLLPPGGVVTSNFGMTEGAGAITYTPLDAPESVRVRSTGTAFPGFDVRIADPETNVACEAGDPGEIQYRSDSAFHAYFEDPAATAATILPGGWIKSGDLGVMDDDRNVDYIGRIKDQLKVGGENVAPVEVESLLAQHPAVNLAQVVGRPDERLGEVPVAFVEFVKDRSASADELIEFVRGKVAGFKVPRAILPIEAWPMSTTKILKSELRKMV